MLQKEYKSFRTGCQLADCALLIEQSWCNHVLRQKMVEQVRFFASLSRIHPYIDLITSSILFQIKGSFPQ
jgi:hypothetical protein